MRKRWVEGRLSHVLCGWPAVCFVGTLSLFVSGVRAAPQPASLLPPKRPHPLFSVFASAAACALQAQRQIGRQQGVDRSALAVASYLDAQLAAVGQADPRFSLLRSCSVSLLRLGTGQAASAQQQQAASGSANDANGIGSRRLFPSVRAIVQQGRTQQARLQQLQVAAAAAEFRIMGGIVSIALGPHTTHVAGAALPPLLSPAAAAAAAAEQRPPAPKRQRRK